jgi:hypothetical protein
MNRIERRKLRPECRFDKLESRELLNAHFARPQVAHADILVVRTARAITGTLSGVSSYTTNPLNPATGGDTYSFSGRTSAGQVGITGTDTWSESPFNASKASDLYFAGDWTMTMGNGSVIAIAYTGSGKTATSATGPWNEILNGTAVGISGSMLGKKFLFSGSGQGTNVSSATTFKIKLSP